MSSTFAPQKSPDLDSMTEELARDIEDCVRQGGVCAGEIDRPRIRRILTAPLGRIAELESKLNSPELVSFRDGVILEAAHQRERWGSSHDAGKEPQDWFWLVGYLAGKALHAAMLLQTQGSNEAFDKALHHCISTAAVLANWHAAILGANNVMRPGISAEKQALAPSDPSGNEEQSAARGKQKPISSQPKKESVKKEP